MKNRKIGRAVFFLGFLILLGYVSAAPRVREAETHEMLDAVLWASTSAEAYAAASQSYQLAIGRLTNALDNPLWTAALEQEPTDFAALPPAILLDLDETVFDNTKFEARIVRELGQYSEPAFKDWVNAADAGAIPGAVEFLSFAARSGVAIFYMSGRLAEYRDATARNIKKLGLPLADEKSNLLLADIGPTTNKRALVAKTHRILLILGDNFDDFADFSRASPDKRRASAETYRRWWGTHWIIVPNAMYGHWEASMYDFRYDLDRSHQLERKREFLPK
jgi:acid phosphatase